MLCWWLECHNTLVKLSAGRGETATAGHWLGLVLWPCRRAQVDTLGRRLEK